MMLFARLGLPRKLNQRGKQASWLRCAVRAEHEVQGRYVRLLSPLPPGLNVLPGHKRPAAGREGLVSTIPKTFEQVHKGGIHATPKILREAVFDGEAFEPGPLRKGRGRTQQGERKGLKQGLKTSNHGAQPDGRELNQTSDEWNT